MNEVGFRFFSSATKRAFAVRIGWLDFGLVLLAVLFGAASLGYPLGHDQGVHFYVAREWLERGSLPYRDAFDHKTPGIYAVHAFAMVLFGVHTWAIRPVEMATVMGLGACVGALAKGRTTGGHGASRGRNGGAVLLVSFLYYGFFTFLSTAQPELWATSFAVAGLLVARRAENLCVGALLAGALGGIALVMKPPIGALLVVVVVQLALRARARLSQAGRVRGRGVGGRLRRASRSVSFTLLVFFVAMTAAPLLVVGYFAEKGGLGAMKDVLVDANAAYFQTRSGVSAMMLVDATGDMFGWFHPVSTLLVIASIVRLVASRHERSRGRVGGLDHWALGVVLVLAAYVSVMGQLRFHIYHYVPLVPGLALLLLNAVDDIRAWVIRSRGTQLGRGQVAVVVCGLALLVSYPLAGRRARTWWAVSVDSLAVFTRRAPTETLDEDFVSAGGRSYVYAESKAVGTWLKVHSSPDDDVSIRGFFPEIYAIADRRSPSHLFWTPGAEWMKRCKHGARWAAQAREIEENRASRFVVVFGSDPPILGYRHRATFGQLDVLERGP